MLVLKIEQQVALGAFLREVERLQLTLKLAARLAGCTPQAVYAWRERDRRMLRKSFGQIKAATLAMSQLKHSARKRFIESTRKGRLEGFMKLRTAIILLLKRGPR